MFKPQVLRRSFSVFNRVPASRIVRSAARDGHESITIHRVRIRKPFFSRQRLVGALAIATATYGLGQYLGLEVEIKEEEVVEEQKPGRWKKQIRKEDGTLEEVDDQDANEGEVDTEEGEDEEDYDDAILFLPTGFSRLRPQTFYKGSDPEWQEFKKVSQDRARCQRIQQELVNLVRKTFSSPAYAAKIGEVDHTKGRAWIEFRFPHGPPPGYERPGYELTEDLEWRKATRDVEPAHHHRLKRLIYPTAVAGALYQDTKRKAERSWKDFAVYMGWAEEGEHHTVNQIIHQLSNPSAPTSPPTPPASAAPADPYGASPPAGAQQSAAQSPPPAAGSAKNLGFAVPDPKALTLDLGQFRQDFQKANARHEHDVPRGSFSVHALVEVYSSKARTTFNIVAVYDPKAGRYIGLHAHVWNQVPLRQSPKGGP